jgi:hypothetical protein
VNGGGCALSPLVLACVDEFGFEFEGDLACGVFVLTGDKVELGVSIVYEEYIYMRWIIFLLSMMLMTTFMDIGIWVDCALQRP